MTDHGRNQLDAHEVSQELPPVRQISVLELKGLMARDARYELVDVRNEAERAIATIEGFRLLDQAYHDDLMECDRETPLIFQCHHGIAWIANTMKDAISGRKQEEQ